MGTIKVAASLQFGNPLVHNFASVLARVCVCVCVPIILRQITISKTASEVPEGEKKKGEEKSGEGVPRKRGGRYWPKRQRTRIRSGGEDLSLVE